MLNSPALPAFFAAAATTFAALALFDVINFVAIRYREKFLQETSTELDDVLIQLPASRLFDISIGLSVAGAVITFGILLLRNPVLSSGNVIASLIVGVLLFPVPRLILKNLRIRRLKKFNIQLEDALRIISTSLKAGFSINQALEEVTEMNISPISQEFRLLLQELRLGVTFEQAFENMNNRLNLPDFELVATAILTARQTGGELTGALERVADLIRERVRIANKIDAMTTMGRLQALLIGAMPFLLLLGMRYVNPGMISGFFDTFYGWVALTAIIILDICGILTIRKITTIEV
ncbi:MAG: type II secretion system F family protein [Lentisphaeria bacterium]|nr:type II secretion system F family protein [Lentisphaeria bacterium]